MSTTIPIDQQIQARFGLGSRLGLLAVVLGMFMLICFGLSLWMAQQAYRDQLRQQQGMRFVANVEKLMPDLAGRASTDRAGLEEQFEQLLLLEPSSALYVLDAQGVVLAGYSRERRINSMPKVSLQPIESLLAGKGQKLVFGDDPDSPSAPCLIAVTPLRGHIKNGYLYAIMRPQPELDGSMLAQRYAMRIGLLLVVVLVILGLIIAAAAGFLLIRPLRRLTDAADQLDATKAVCDQSLPGLKRSDEIGTLARAFARMVQRVQEQYQQLQRMDATRREWVSNVSHDLRTPLTSLMGHLELLVNRQSGNTGTVEIKPEEVQYLHIAMRNAKQLDRLCTSLSDLSRLDSPDVRLDLAPTAVGELLDDVVARFATTASEKQIALTSHYPDHLPLVVLDVGMIERALANLIDNALRYTPVYGTVRVEAAVQDAKDQAGKALHIRVQDSGSGIPEQDITRVFERFFQGAQQREGKGQAGLGLAIVRRVAQLHAGSAHAGNAATGGAQFELRIPITQPST